MSLDYLPRVRLPTFIEVVKIDSIESSTKRLDDGPERKSILFTPTCIRLDKLPFLRCNYFCKGDEPEHTRIKPIPKVISVNVKDIPVQISDTFKYHI